MLNLILRGSVSFSSIIAYAIASLVIVFFILPFHEFAHGFTANILGDRTAKYQGRLTLNPMAHIDWIGALLIILFGFGWAKPVQVNMRNFKNPKAGMAITALAGPFSNLLAAFVFSFVKGGVVLMNFKGIISFSVFTFVSSVISFFIEINVTLAVFNLIPIPPLDGSRLLTAFLPDRLYYKFMQYERIFFFVILALCWFGAFSSVLGTVAGTIKNAFVNLAVNFFSLFV